MFGNKCEYCRKKIDEGKEVQRDVKVPGYIGTHSKHFCCEEHVEKYKQEVKEHQKKQEKGGGCGCG